MGSDSVDFERKRRPEERASASVSKGGRLKTDPRYWIGLRHDARGWRGVGRSPSHPW